MIFAWILNAGVVGFVLWAAQLTARQRRKKKQQSRELVISPMAGLALGAMLTGFQAIVHPQVRHMIVEEQKEESVDDARGDELPGGRAFHRGLRRVRQGEEVEVLTVRVDSPVAGSITD
ncbi:MAG TPA: hypothetical protein VHZ09_03270 [Acidobacteriaceae bacterium]|nr:hypothetical protein [Acidobacteriaceae bacterium]